MGKLGNSSWTKRVTLSRTNLTSANQKSLAQTPAVANPQIAVQRTEPTTQATQDRVIASASVRTPSAVANQPNLTTQETTQPRTVHTYLDASEIQVVENLPKHIQQDLLNIDPSKPVGQVREEMKSKLKTTVQKMIGGDIKFQGKGNRDWGLSGLLNLTRSLERMPSSQRSQLKGITFERAAKADHPEGIPRNLLTNLAQEVTAGKYDIQAKKVILFDRGTHDDFPALSKDLQSSLRQISSKGKNDDIKSLQTMLNPYLTKLNLPNIEPDGAWGENTEKALRIVQVELLTEHLESNHNLTSAQKAELKDLSKLAASPHFDTITRMTDIGQKMQNLNLLPDAQMKSLLEDFAESDFGSTSMQFIIQDISKNFRSTMSVNRSDEVLTHEMGHHFQLGADEDNMSFYIKEFSKLGQWLNVDDQTVADGSVAGAYASEDMMDVYNVLASDNTVDEGFYRTAMSPEERSEHFVSSYAATDPMEDFAESYKTFLIEPEVLMEKSPEKFFFMNAMPSMQAEEKRQSPVSPHYNPQEIREIGAKALSKKWNTQATDLHVNDFIRNKLESITTGKNTSSQLELAPQTARSIYKSHTELLEQLEMKTFSSASSKDNNQGDAEIYNKITEQAQQLIRSRGEDQSANTFFNTLREEGGVEKLFPQASSELQTNLNDKAFSGMMLALGEIAGHATFLNDMWIDEDQDETDYSEARSYFGRIMDEPSQLFSRKIASHAYNAMRSVGTKIYNPETSKASASLAFFDKLKTNPSEALSTVWNDLPKSFQNQLQDQKFIQNISGNEGRYMPSGEAIQNTLQELMLALEYDRMMESYMTND